MAERGVGALLVMEGPKLLGIISERDYARRVILQGRRSADTRVEEIMTRDVIAVSVDMTVEQGLALMTERHFRHLPVIEEGPRDRRGVDRRPRQGSHQGPAVRDRGAAALRIGLSRTPVIAEKKKRRR
jgi:predicted transcriptional regulator